MKEAVGEPFMLQNLIVPVALVDPPSITAITATMVLDIPTTAGELVAPAAGTRLADTGQLVGGKWDIFMLVECEDTSNLRLRRRNAVDAADIWAQKLNAVGGNIAVRDITFLALGPLRFNFLTNERLVIEAINAGTAGASYQANIWTSGPN
jgi:hypothetical protein